MGVKTPNLNLNQPTVGGDDDTWGNDPGGWNENARLLDDLFSPTTGHTHDGTGTNGSPIVPPGLAGMSADGLVVRTSAATHTPRSIAAGDAIKVNNGDGVAGNPTIIVDMTTLGQELGVAADDQVLISDTSDGGNNKRTTVEAALRIADTAATTAGVVTDQTVSPRGLSQSRFGTIEFPLYLVDGAADVIVQNGLFYWPWTDKLTGMNIVGAFARVVTAGSGGSLLTVDVVNTRTTNSIFTTPITIDPNETTSRSAATPPVINAAEQTPQLDDLLRYDITAIPTTPQKGLIVTLVARIP